MSNPVPNPSNPAGVEPIARPISPAIAALRPKFPIGGAPLSKVEAGCLRNFVSAFYAFINSYAYKDNWQHRRKAELPISVYGF